MRPADCTAVKRLRGEQAASSLRVHKHHSGMGAPGSTGMEERMEESYIEGAANRDGPESCAGFREGVGEALTRERIG